MLHNIIIDCIYWVYAIGIHVCKYVGTKNLYVLNFDECFFNDLYFVLMSALFCTAKCNIGEYDYASDE